MPPPPDSTNSSSDPGAVDELVGEILDRLEDEGDVVIDEVCAREPKAEVEIRRKLGILRRTGMLPPSASDGGASASTGGVPERLGEFRILQRIGQGGMGVVHLAVQEPLNRQVAIKLVRPENLWFSGARERFQREVESVSRLAHPGILPVHTVGEENGVPFLVMEYVEGLTLSDLLAMLHDRAPQDLSGADALRALLMARDARRAERSSSDVTGAGKRSEASARRSRTATSAERRASASKTSSTGDASNESGFDAGGQRLFQGNWVQFCVRIASRVAEALSHAHATGILHRDVKPSNIFLTPSGRVLLFDFGLAYPEGEERLTRSGARLGSLPYMAPEQLEPALSSTSKEGKAASADGDECEDPGLGPWTDVYGLGVTLFELLTLRCAHDAGGGEAIRRSILDGIARSVRRLNPSVPVDAETVCLTAMERDPTRRYATAAEFGRDAENFLHRRSIQARPMGWVLRARRWSERHPARATAAALILGGLLLALVTVPALMTVAIAKERDEAILARSQADEARTEAVLAREREAGLRAEAEAGRAREELLRLAERKNAARANLSVADLAVRTGEAARLHEMLAGVPEDLRRFEWSALSRRSDATLLDLPLAQGVWSSTTAAEHPHRFEAIVVRDMPDGEQIRYELVDLQSGAVRWVTEPATDPDPWVFFTADGRLFTQLHDKIEERDPDTGKLTRDPFELPERFGLPTFSADGELVAWLGPLQKFKLYSTVDGSAIGGRLRGTNGLSSFRGNVFFGVHVDGDGLTMSRNDQTEPIYKVGMPRSAWGSIRATKNHIVWLIEDELQVHDFQTGVLRAKLNLGSNPTVLADSPDGSKLFVLMAPRSLAVVDLESRRIERRIFMPDIVISVTGSWRENGALTITTPGRLRIVSAAESATEWTYMDRSVFSRSGVLSGACKGMEFSADSSRLAFNLVDGSIKIIEVETQEPLPPCLGHTDSVSAMTVGAPTAAEPLGCFASASWDGSVRIWSFATGACLRVIRFTDTSPVAFLKFTPDQERIVLLHVAGHGRVLSLSTGEAVELDPVPNPHGKVLTAGYGTDGTLLVRAGNGFLSAWNVTSGALLAHSKQRADLVSAGHLAESDLPRITSDSIPSIVQRSIEMSDHGHSRMDFGADRSVALSPCGERLLVASLGGTTTLWDTETVSPVYDVEHRVRMPMRVAFAPSGLRLAILGAPAQVTIATANHGKSPMQALAKRTALTRTRDRVDAAFVEHVREADVRKAVLTDDLAPIDAEATEAWIESRRDEPRRFHDEAFGIAFSPRRSEAQYLHALALIREYLKFDPDALDALCLEGALSVRVRDLVAAGAAFDRASELVSSQGIESLSATSLGHWAVYLSKLGDDELADRLMAELKSRGEPSGRPPNVNAVKFFIAVDRALKNDRR